MNLHGIEGLLSMKLEGIKRLQVSVAAAVLFMAGFYFFVHLPLRAYCENSAEEIAVIKEEILELQNFQNAHLDLTAYRQGLEARKTQADKALPEHLAQGDFLGRIQADALGTGMEVQQAAPREVSSQEGGYVALPVSLRVAGSYFELLDFLGRLRQEERFYQFRQMQVKGNGDGRLQAELLLVMFAGDT